MRAVPRRRFACPRPNVPCAARNHNHNKPPVAHNTSSFSLSLFPVCFEFPFLLCVQMKERSVGQDSVASGAPWTTRQHASIGVTSTRTQRALCCVRVERSWCRVFACVCLSLLARSVFLVPASTPTCILHRKDRTSTNIRRYTQKQTVQCWCVDISLTCAGTPNHLPWPATGRSRWRANQLPAVVAGRTQRHASWTTTTSYYEHS